MSAWPRGSENDLIEHGVPESLRIGVLALLGDPGKESLKVKDADHGGDTEAEGDDLVD